MTDSTVTDVVQADDKVIATAEEKPDVLAAVPEGYDIRDVEQFLYREARFADESDYDSWEALWTDDALYWVPAGNDDGPDPLQRMSIVYDNRSRISTRLKQLRTGRRYAQAPPSNLRRLISNVELLGGRLLPAAVPIWRWGPMCWSSSPAPAARTCGERG